MAAADPTIQERIIRANEWHRKRLHEHLDRQITDAIRGRGFVRGGVTFRADKGLIKEIEFAGGETERYNGATSI